MRKREFVKTLGIGSLAVAASRLVPSVESLFGRHRDGRHKQWTWVATDLDTSLDDWKERFAVMRRAGIDAILPEVYDGRHAYYQSDHLPVEEAWLESILPLAKEEGLEVHAWMWSMPCNIKEVRQEHPEWFVVNRRGESAAERPAYVEYYRFLCPSRPEVHQFIQTTVAELSRYEALDGIHLDYIRYPDVILPEALQPKYGLRQVGEEAEYDYCYCDVCLREFEKETGIELLKLEDPTTSKEWRQFRYDRITRLVNETLIPAAHRSNKMLTAAVFPNWEMVRQQWPAWKLDAALPMLYHTLYGKDTGWIKEQTEKGVKALPDRTPLYSGLMVTSPEELSQAIDAALEGGAQGVVLFTAQGMTDEHWRSFSQAIKR